jgi:serine/threonine-protein kinase
VKLLILGAKDWELENSEHVLNMVAEYKDIYYLFNFLNGRQFNQIQKSMNHRNTYRIPYEPDPFADNTVNNDAQLFEELLQPLEQWAFQGRTGTFSRRGRTHET